MRFLARMKGRVEVFSRIHCGACRGYHSHLRATRLDRPRFPGVGIPSQSMGRRNHRRDRFHHRSLHSQSLHSATALFTAVGIARVNPWYILPPFFCGRLITDGVMVYTGKFAAGNLSDLVHGEMSLKTVLIAMAGLFIIGAFLFIDWRSLLEKRKLRLNFNILR